MYTRFLCLLLLMGSLFTIPAMGQSGKGKYRLKVLYVGYDPSRPLPEIGRMAPGGMSKEGFTAEYPVRMPAFKALLGENFTEVTAMDCRDWKPDTSEPFDVTIFDFKPNPLPQQDTARIKQHHRPAFLPNNFSKPTVFIANTAPEMGEAIGLKLDWLCLCLDADAHHINTKHPIFKGPLNKVSPTLKTKATPEGIFHYTTGKSVPKQIPMWTVQEEGYLTDKDARIGLVARGNRFAEGPDAEVISSGVCTKDVQAVALGRHGNFFLWGFGSSPLKMTEEAKKVFINTVAYMKQFNGKTPITRKYNDRMATTDNVREIIANATKESFEESVEEIKKFNEHNRKEKTRIDAKVAAGEKLTSQEETMLPYLGYVQELPTWESHMKSLTGKYYEKFGNDAAAFQQYMNTNFDYIYCDPKAFFSYEIDEDVATIGVPNHSLKLLDACISMLERKVREDMALRVLKRYTGENFTAAAEWKSWLAKHRKKLFFSETNGYRFVINTYN
ncbi:hypothetical protein [Chitinophaga deserti]|uniref:hypothetical protein n=1 Tax=Chitinophaga deserti TaxID=2164099 RepID=UPI0013003C13|nr:hypothetical protein [Chitinophaga deserti]